MRSIGGVCLGVGLLFAFGAWGKAEAQPSRSPPIMLDGHCPVTLIEQHRWEKGDPRFGAVHEGRTYLFVGQAEKLRFVEAPRKYAPPLPAEIAKPLTPIVGDLGKPANWEIHGATTFTAAEVNKALFTCIEVAAAARAGLPLDRFLTVLADQARLGYQSDGFPDVNVGAFVDHARHKVVLTIDEGPRFMAGEIQVMQTRTIDAAWLVDQLTPVADSLPQGGAADTWSPAKKNNGTRWPTGKPAWFDDISLIWLRERVETLLADLGRVGADFTLDVTTEPSRGVAPLVVRFRHEGRPATIDEIEISGNERSSREEVLAFLELRPGMLFTREVRERIDEWLIHSGRFTKSNVRTIRPTKPGDPLKLRITITEYPKAPPLSQPLSREEAALVRFSQWVRHFDEGDDDLIIQYFEAARVWEAVASPRHGVLLVVRNLAGDENPGTKRRLFPTLWRLGARSKTNDGNRATAPFQSAFVATEKRIGLYSAERRQKFGAVSMPSVLSLSLGLKIHDGASKFNGKGALTYRLGASPAGRSRHVKFELEQTAVAALALAHLDDSRCTWEGGTLRVDYGGRHLRIDERSGRLVDHLIDGRTGRLIDHIVDMVTRDEGVYRVAVARGEFQRSLAEIDSASVGYTDVADISRGLTSACEFVCVEALAWPLVADDPETRRLVSAGRELIKLGPFAPLDRLIVTTMGSTPVPSEFSVPLRQAPQGHANNWEALIRMFAYYFGLPLANGLWPEGSWTWDMWREATLAAAGRTQHSASELARQFWSPDIGPLECLLDAQLAQELGVPRLATIYARHGCPRLTLAEFRHDYAPFVSPDGFVGQSVLSAADALRRLNVEDRRVLIDAIVAQKWLTPDAAQVIDGALGRMRLDQHPIALALSAELDSVWESSLQAGVKSMLVSLEKTAAPDTAQRPEPPTYATGAKPPTYGAAAGPPKPPHDAPNWPLFELCQILSYSDTYPAARIEDMHVDSAGAQSGPVEPPPVGLSSQCPVTFRDERVWQRGDDRFGAVHRGHVYLFTSAEKQARFLADPDQYCPVDSGYDVVSVIEQHKDHRGEPEFAVLYDGRIYLFEGDETREKFIAHPARYIVTPPAVVTARESGNNTPARR